MEVTQEGMRKKKGPSTSTHQPGRNPAADATHMLCFGSGLSEVVAVDSNVTTPHYAKALAEFSISSTRQFWWDELRKLRVQAVHVSKMQFIYA